MNGKNSGHADILSKSLSTGFYRGQALVSVNPKEEGHFGSKSVQGMTGSQFRFRSAEDTQQEFKPYASSSVIPANSPAWEASLRGKILTLEVNSPMILPK